jgi:hypothetical protein
VIDDESMTVGEILEKYCGVEGASTDPSMAYIRHSWWFQQQELLAAEFRKLEAAAKETERIGQANADLRLELDLDK